MNLTDWNEWIGLGERVGREILWFANLIAADHWPGLLSLGFLTVALLVSIVIWWQSRASISALDQAVQAAKNARSNRQGLDLATLGTKLRQIRGESGRRPEHAFAEFRETLIEIGRGDDSKVRNSIRPSAFLNPEDLGFSLRGWRFVPGIFVSLGLFLTFLGLVAVLSSTADILPNGQATDQAETMRALRVLLRERLKNLSLSA